MLYTIRQLIAAGDLRQALEQLGGAQPAALALLGDYNRGHQAYMLNTIGFEEWSRIQSKLAQAALALMDSPPAPSQTQPSPATTNKAHGAQRKVFLSYSHQDEAMKDQLNVFFAPLRRSGKIAVWHDRQILPGEEWDPAIKQELAEADLILLLVSPHFLASDYIWQNEISKAMERHERREAVVIPVILRPCDWQDMPFAKVQGLPRNARPVTQYANADDAYLEIVQGIRRVLGA